jgi:hypothetical protein
VCFKIEILGLATETSLPALISIRHRHFEIQYGQVPLSCSLCRGVNPNNGMALMKSRHFGKTFQEEGAASGAG